MQTEMPDTFQQDALVIDAIRKGDPERYRELVERHERRIYALAWSRLGDATLAEEATQEAFIRAYRGLWMLGDSSKFAGWIAVIARRVCIGFGIRRRKELDKRQRWALEHSAHEAGDSEEVYTPEMLRQTLAELPHAHRECLVLFYLEGKSGAEAAVALGISETALRVRLLRARGILRERLEKKLEKSLDTLRPSKRLVPAVMAGVLASQSSKAATVGVVTATVAKFTPLKWVFTFVPFIFPALMFLPMLVLQRWRTKEEQRNYRDQEGFRPKLHGRIHKRMFLWFVVFGLALGLATTKMRPHLSSQTFFLIFGLISAANVLFVGRQFQINRSGFQVRVFVSQSLMTAVLIAVGMGWTGFAFTGMLMASGLLVAGRQASIARLDYNLFLRASQKMFPETDPEAVEHEQRLDRPTLLSFARFLSERWMVCDFRWKPTGLTLRLRPVNAYSALTTSVFSALFFGLFTARSSWIQLGWDGSVKAHCSERDARELAALHTEPISVSQLETQVTAAVSGAWRQFRSGDTKAAEQTLGQVSEQEIFVRPARLANWPRVILTALVVFGILCVLVSQLFRLQLSGLKNVNLSEAQVREFLSHVAVNPNPLRKEGAGFTQAYFRWDAALPLFNALALPETNLFTPQGLQGMRDTVAGEGGFERWKQSVARADVFGSPLRRAAIAIGWISWNDLALQPSDAEAYQRAYRANAFNQEHFFTHGQSWSWVKEERFNVLRINLDGVTQLQLLRNIHCLDLVDREKLIQQITSVQTLSAHPPGQPPIHDWKDVRGLFFTPGWPALLDTYYSLAALEIVGGLDRIDREACIQGILRRHKGKGFFTSPDSGGFNEYHIIGEACDTIAAYESLRILVALDRVKDLDQWQFRVHKRDMPNGEVTWTTVEAATAQQRLAAAIAEHRKSPSTPWQSLVKSSANQ